jgi:predicted nucleic acid-binding protein
MMTLCDTNVFIYAFNGRQDTIDKLTEIGFQDIVLSSISVMELYQGMGNKVELAQMKRKIKYFDVIEINDDASKLATKLIENYRLSHNLQIPDAIIGATAIIHQLRLFTYNIKDFAFMPGIKLI